MVPLVTVGIPTYNRPEGLRRTLEQITNQTFVNLEIIISDNASPNPEVEKISSEFQSIDQRITVFRHRDNQGIVANFKFVLRKATGDYFMWAADDDEWKLNYIESCVDVLETNEKVILCSGISERRHPKTGKVLFLYDPISNFDQTAGQRAFSMARTVLLGKPRIASHIYGVMRTEAIKGISIKALIGSDLIQLYDLTLQGGIHVLPEVFCIKWGERRPTSDFAKMLGGREKTSTLSVYWKIANSLVETTWAIKDFSLLRRCGFTLYCFTLVLVVRGFIPWCLRILTKGHRHVPSE